MKNQKRFANILIVILVVLVLGGGVYLFVNSNGASSSLIIEERTESDNEVGNKDNDTEETGVEPAPGVSPTSVPAPVVTPTPTPVACTADAMQCPDGSFVGRTGPNCEFVCSDPEDDNVEPMIKVISPNGGEIWSSDNEYTVSWSYDRLSEDDRVNLGFRSSDNQNICWLEPVNVGLESFKITPEEVDCGGESLAGEYRFQIVVEKYANGKGVADMSDDSFVVE